MTKITKREAAKVLAGGGKVFAGHCKRSEFGFVLWSVAMLDAIADCRVYRFWV